MRYAYLLLAAAQEEYEDAITWYGERSLAAAEQFIESVDHSLESICEHPERWRNEFSHYHELGVHKYPYSIVYSIEPENNLVIISSIYHHSRDPKRKYKK